MIKKILFLHGFFASGSCIPAQALRQAFASKAEVLTPDLPLHPKEALAFIEDICQQEKPCVLVAIAMAHSWHKSLLLAMDYPPYWAILTWK